MKINSIQLMVSWAKINSKTLHVKRRITFNEVAEEVRVSRSISPEGVPQNTSLMVRSPNLKSSTEQ